MHQCQSTCCGVMGGGGSPGVARPANAIRPSRHQDNITRVRALEKVCSLPLPSDIYQQLYGGPNPTTNAKKVFSISFAWGYVNGHKPPPKKKKKKKKKKKQQQTNKTKQTITSTYKTRALSCMYIYIYIYIYIYVCVYVCVCVRVYLSILRVSILLDNTFMKYGL